MPKDIGLILRNAEEILQTARLGYYNLTASDRARRLCGLRNLIVFAHASAVVLQRLEATTDRALFKRWHADQQKMMASNATFSFFNTLRDEILEKADTPTFTSWSPKFSSSEIGALGRPPVGATGFFIGDESTGSGWIIALPDNREERYYVQPPASMSQLEHLLATAAVHSNGTLNATSIEALCCDYLDKLDKILGSARNTFLIRKSG